MSKTLVVYLMSGRRRPSSPRRPSRAAPTSSSSASRSPTRSRTARSSGGPPSGRSPRGMRTAACLECLAEMRARVGETPLVPMTYASLLEAYGWERFDADAREAGATSLIVADLPAGEQPELRRIQLVAPTSTDERIALAARRDGRLALPRDA